MIDWRPGTYYACGCWHGGDCHQHPQVCPTHKKDWRFRYHYRDGSRVSDERYTNGNTASIIEEEKYGN